MSENPLDRRQFNRLTAAAFSGMVAGSMSGCGGGSPPANVVVVNPDLHLCRGLNDCQGKGADGKNTCRGQGTCANVVAHECGGHNDCKNLGGCGADAGRNACKGKGGCSVPLMDSAWKSIRDRLESQWKAKPAEFGVAPAKADPAPKSEPAKAEESKE